MKWILLMMRESRGSRGRLLFFTACIAIGVAAVVGVASLAGAVADGLRGASRDLLAADLVVTSRRPIDPSVEALVVAAGATGTTRAREFATMVAPVDEQGASGRSRIARLKAVDGEFPFYGTIELDPPGPLGEALARGAVVAPEFGVRPGGRMRIGRSVVTVAAVVRREPQQFGFSNMLGPRIFVREADLEDSGLLGWGSRFRYDLLVRFPRPEVLRLKVDLMLKAPGAEFLQVETWRDGQPRIRQSVERVESYLGLVALLSLILGGVGVAQIAQAWIASRTPAIAILRCIGMRPREILRLFLGQIALLACIGSVAGAVLGSLGPLVFLAVASDLFPRELITGSMFQPEAIARGLALGVVVAMLFALPPLTAVWRVSPARVLRNDAEPLPPPRLVRIGAIAVMLLGILGTAWVQGGRFTLGLYFTLGFIGLVGVLTLGARTVTSLAGRIPRGRLHPYLAQGLSALARPGAGTTGGIVALGLGVTVVVSMAIVQRELSSGIRQLIPADAPNVFLVDVQPDQWPDVESKLAARGATAVRSAAIVMGRLREINGRTVTELAREQGGGRRHWVLTREQRMAPLSSLPEDNTIVAGALWSEPDAYEISLEEGYARDMGVALGDRLKIDVQGVVIDYQVTSLRKVEWRSFSLNFFVVVEPGSLDGAPSLRFAAAKLAPPDEQPLQDDLAAAYPNVTMIKVRPIIDQVVTVMESMSTGVGILGAFTVFAGLAILAGAISAATVRRRREAALLKTLGATRRGVGALFLTEYGLLGAVAGLLGAIGAIALAWGFLSGVADLRFTWPLWTIPVATLLAAALAAGCGILSSLRALRAPPRESLRG